MKRPQIYGDGKRFKANLGQHVQRAHSLLSEAEGVRNRIAKEAAKGKGNETLVVYALGQEWTEKALRWRKNVGKFVLAHLGEQTEELLPILTTPLPPDTGKPRHEKTIENMEPWLQDVVAELVELQGALGVSRNVASVTPPGARFAELSASGLVDQNVIDAHARDLKDPKRPKQLADAIGAAKELTEATLRGALDRMGEPWTKADDFPRLMKKWRQATGAAASPDLTAKASFNKAQSALSSVVQFLAEWRNAYGSGHGKPKFPPGLRPRHARLAADAAETAIRFIVTTMDDLALLAPG